MFLIEDDPIIRCAMRTGYPPWVSDYSPEADSDEEREAMVCITSDGMTYCEECENILECDLFTKMPDYCPHCEARLNYSGVFRKFMKGAVVQ